MTGSSLYQAFQQLYQRLLDKRGVWELTEKGKKHHAEVARLALEWVDADRKLAKSATSAIEFLEGELAKENGK